MIDLCIEICDNYYLWGVIWGVKSVVLSRLRQREFHHLHLFVHEVIREVRIHLSNKSVRAISHPKINNVRANVLLAYCCESMTQTICRFICKQFFHNIIDF